MQDYNNLFAQFCSQWEAHDVSQPWVSGSKHHRATLYPPELRKEPSLVDFVRNYVRQHVFAKGDPNKDCIIWLSLRSDLHAFKYLKSKAYNNHY